MTVRLRLSTPAQHALRNAPPAAKRELKRALESLRRGTKGLDVRELRQASGAVPVYRLKVGTWRIAFRHHGKELEVVRVFPRRDGYGWMERLG